MKLTILGGVVFVAAITAGLAAQAPDATTERTIMGCVKGDGTEANPWTLTGVIIPVPPPPAPPGAGGGRGGGGRGAAPAAGGAPPAAGGAPPAAGGAPPAAGGAPPAAGGAPPAGEQGRGGRGAGGGGGRGAAPAGPPPPPPPPQNFKLTGINMTPWANVRAEVTGAGTNNDFKVVSVRSMWGGGCQ
jgi:hypothetical protein